MYVIDIIDSIERDVAKNLLGSENFRKKMSSLLITCGSWWRGLYPQSCLFMFLCYVVAVVVVSKHIHNLLLSLSVCFYYRHHGRNAGSTIWCRFLFVFIFDPIVLTLVFRCASIS